MAADAASSSTACTDGVRRLHQRQREPRCPACPVGTGAGGEECRESAAGAASPCSCAAAAPRRSRAPAARPSSPSSTSERYARTDWPVPGSATILGIVPERPRRLPGALELLRRGGERRPQRRADALPQDAPDPARRREPCRARPRALKVIFRYGGRRGEIPGFTRDPDAAPASISGRQGPPAAARSVASAARVCAAAVSGTGTSCLRSSWAASGSAPPRAGAHRRDQPLEARRDCSRGKVFSGTCTVTPSCCGPGLEAIRQPRIPGRPASSCPAVRRWSSAATGLISSSRVNVSRSGRSRRSSRHQRSKCAPETIEIRDPRGIEVVERLVVDEDVAPARAILERLDLLDQLPRCRRRSGGGCPSRPPRARGGSNRSRDRDGVDRPVGHGTPGDDRQPVQGHPLGGDDRGAGASPSADRHSCGGRGAPRAARPSAGRSAPPSGPRAARSRPARRPSPRLGWPLTPLPGHRAKRPPRAPR